MWKRLLKEVDLGGPTSFLDHVHLGCTQRECKIKTDIIDERVICLTPGYQLEVRDFTLPKGLTFGLVSCLWFELPTASGPKSARVYCGY